MMIDGDDTDADDDDFGNGNKHDDPIQNRIHSNRML